MNERIIALLHKTLNELSLDEAEKKELDDWLSQSPHNRSLYEEITTDPENLQKDVREMLLYDSKAIWSKIEQRRQGKIFFIQTPKNRWWLQAAAIILFIMISVGAFFFSNYKTKPGMANTEPTEKRFKNDVEPGREKATLTLADGTIVALDNTANGTIAQQGNTVIMKEDGLLAYNTDRNTSQAGILYNTLTTQKGGEYRSLVLSDGSKIWLNSVSSIHYPTAFIGKERTVDITGEAYFEVAKNRAMPFKVNVNGMQVEVLGTHFNINAYGDETVIKTTLLEGAVKIVAGGKASFLKPGQQAMVSSPPTGGGGREKAAEIKIINDADVEEVVAWKNGMFSFKKGDIETIMRQVSRWYDVDVVFKDKISGHFVVTGIPRTVPVSKLLQVLEMMGGVHFEIDGKKILVKH